MARQRKPVGTIQHATRLLRGGDRLYQTRLGDGRILWKFVRAESECSGAVIAALRAKDLLEPQMDGLFEAAWPETSQTWCIRAPAGRGVGKRRGAR